MKSFPPVTPSMFIPSPRGARTSSKWLGGSSAGTAPTWRWKTRAIGVVEGNKIRKFPQIQNGKSPWKPMVSDRCSILSQSTDLKYGLDIFMILDVCGQITELRHSPNMLQQGPLVGQLQWSELAFGKLMWKSNISGSQLRYVTIMLRWRSAMKTMVAAAVAVRAFFSANHFSCHFLDHRPHSIPFIPILHRNPHRDVTSKCWNLHELTFSPSLPSKVVLFKPL